MIKEEAVEITKRKVEDGDAKDDKKNSSKVRRRHRGSRHERITSREEVFCCSHCDKQYGSKERCRRHIKRCQEKRRRRKHRKDQKLEESKGDKEKTNASKKERRTLSQRLTDRSNWEFEKKLEAFSERIQELERRLEERTLTRGKKLDKVSSRLIRKALDIDSMESIRTILKDKLHVCLLRCRTQEEITQHLRCLKSNLLEKISSMQLQVTPLTWQARKETAQEPRRLKDKSHGKTSVQDSSARSEIEY